MQGTPFFRSILFFIHAVQGIENQTPISLTELLKSEMRKGYYILLSALKLKPETLIN